MTRCSQHDRKTRETHVSLSFDIDGSGRSSIQTGIPFFDHMLVLFTQHGWFDLSLTVKKGDTDVDFHHTVEDVGIGLGKAFADALGDAKGISRYASINLPMDEVLCQIAVDISNRPFLAFNAAVGREKHGHFDVDLTEEFFKSFVFNARIGVHLTVACGTNLHHMIESCFKALGVVLDRATAIDPRKQGVIPSTKGVL